MGTENDKEREDEDEDEDGDDDKDEEDEDEEEEEEEDDDDDEDDDEDDDDEDDEDDDEDEDNRRDFTRIKTPSPPGRKVIIPCPVPFPSYAAEKTPLESKRWDIKVIDRTLISRFKDVE